MDLASLPSDSSREELSRALLTFFERATDGIFITDQQLRFVEVNPHGCEMLGYSRQEILALSLVDLIPDEDLARDLLYLDDLHAGKVLVGKGSVRCRNARLLPVEARSQMLSDGRLLCIAHDLTERQQIEVALRRSEERLELALEGADLGMWDWHVPTGEVVFNERWAEMLGYTLAEIEPHVRSWVNLLHPDDAPEVMKILTAHLEGKTPIYQTEHRLRAKSGEWKWVLDIGRVFTRDESGKPIRVVGMHQDITEHKRAESQREAALNALRESEQKYRVVFESIPDAAYLIEQRTGRILDVNAAATRILGYSREELTSLKNSDILADPIETDSATREFERFVPIRYHKRKDGTVFPVEINANAFRLQERIMVISICRDITEHLRADTEREKLIAELQAALAQVKRLSGLLPICASCKKIRDDKGYWQQVEVYIRDHAEVEFSHGICPDCKEKLYPKGEYPFLYPEE